jgi:hypothetical protein
LSTKEAEVPAKKMVKKVTGKRKKKGIRRVRKVAAKKA